MAEFIRSSDFHVVVGAVVLLLGVIGWGAILLQAIENLFGGENTNVIGPVEKE